MTFATPATIKQAARDSKIYEAATTYTKSTAANVNINPVVKAGLDDAATSSFTPEYLQASAEQFIDGTYHWLDGTTDKPDFKIDATAAVNQFLGKVGDSTASYTQNLPVCPAGQALPNLNGTDLNDLKCIPRGITIPNVREETINRLRASNDFLANPVITADSLPDLTQSNPENVTGTNNTPATKNASQPLYKQFSQLPLYFQILRALPWIFGLISLLAAIWMFAIYHNPRKATYRLARSLLWVSLPVAIFTGLGHLVFNTVADQGGGIAQAVEGTFQQYSVAFVRSIENTLAHNLLLVSGSLAAVSGLITFVFFISNRRNKSEADHGYKDLAEKAELTPNTKPLSEPEITKTLAWQLPPQQAPNKPSANPPAITHDFKSPPTDNSLETPIKKELIQ